MPGNARPLAPRTSLQAVLLLGSMGMLATLWSDTLFPAMVSIQQDLRTSATAVQQTVSLFFVANAFMCLWHGVISDAWGRRKAWLSAWAMSCAALSYGTCTAAKRRKK